jgi:hypothetical protein
MRWKLEVADRQSGAESVIELEAESETAAIKEAGQRGLFVSAVSPVPTGPALEYGRPRTKPVAPASVASAILGLSMLGSEAPFGGALLILVGVGMGYGSWQTLRSVKPTYVLQIVTTAGQAQVVSTADRETVEAIERAVNAAIVARG